MGKTYKTDLGSIIFIVFGILLLLILFIFVFNEVPLFMKFIVMIIITANIIFLFMLLRYSIIISDDSISVKSFRISFFNKYQTMKFGEIYEVQNIVGPFSDMPVIVFKSRNKSKKPLCILVGFGLPWQALLDILQRLPKDVEIDFEPLLWKLLKKPPKSDTIKTLIIKLLIIVFIISAVFIYCWWRIYVKGLF